MSRTRALLLAGLALLLAASTVRGAEGQGVSEAPVEGPGPYVGARIGYLEVEEVDGGSLNVGIVGGFAFDRVLELEGSLDYHTADYDTNNRATIALQASLCVHPFPALRRVRPYVVGGVGVYYSDYDPTEEEYSPADTRVWDAGYHAGFGVEIPAGWMQKTETLFTMDVRYLFTHEERDDPQRIEPDGVLATIGVKLRF